MISPISEFHATIFRSCMPIRGWIHILNRHFFLDSLDWTLKPEGPFNFMGNSMEHRFRFEDFPGDPPIHWFTELDDGNIYRKPLYIYISFMVKKNHGVYRKPLSFMVKKNNHGVFQTTFSPNPNPSEWIEIDHHSFCQIFRKIQSRRREHWFICRRPQGPAWRVVYLGSWAGITSERKMGLSSPEKWGYPNIFSCWMI